jgi:signal transduction histidine kinase
MVGELAAKVAHEIKNPLAGMYAAVQLLSRGMLPVESQREIFDDLAHEIRRLDETARDLLNFARPIVPKALPTPFASFLADQVESLMRQPEVARHSIELEVDPELEVSIDARLMGQVVSNLIHNAAQAMESKGSIHIRATVAQDLVTLEVADSGPGIPAAILERIFDPFFTTKSRGTGLGLSIAKKNVEAHGGTLEVDNPPSGGARFRISLPRERSGGRVRPSRRTGRASSRP